jgi:hypothetical protein
MHIRPEKWLPRFRPPAGGAGSSRGVLAAAFPLWVLLQVIPLQAGHAQGPALRATTPRSHPALNPLRASEAWVRKWDIQQTALVFPDGGSAGFYRRPSRTADASPPTGRDGVLYLYPESRHLPVRLHRSHVEITPSASRLELGVCANRRPRGEWILKVFADKRQTGRDLLISGEEGWQDIACNLSAFTGRRVDIDIEGHAAGARAAHVFIDYIRLADPAGQPVTRLPEPGGRAPEKAYGPVREPGEPAGQVPSSFFDDHYRDFLELLLDREERRQFNQMIHRERDCRERRRLLRKGCPSP